MGSSKHREWLDVSPRADGGTWRLPMLRVAGAAPGPRLVLFGAVHGDEYDGPEVIHRVFERIEPRDVRGEVVMIPVCNVAAYEVCARLSPVDGANLARVFPGRPDGTLTERIAHVLTEQAIRGADALIDIHSGGMAYSLPTLAGYTHSDAPLHRANRALAEAFGAPVVWAHPAPLPAGRSLSAADALGVPCMYTEAAGAGRVAPDVLNCFVQGVFNVMRHLGMLAGAPAVEPPRHRLIGDGNLDQIILAPCAGHFRADVELLEPVLTGQRLGAVFNLLGEPLADVRADRDGVVITLRALHRVNAGDGLVHLTNIHKDSDAT